MWNKVSQNTAVSPTQTPNVPSAGQAQWALPQMRYDRPRRGPWLQLRHPAGFEWNTAELEIHDLPPALENLRIVHVTDFHTRAYWCKEYDVLHDRLRADPPDLLLLTGDYVENKYDPGPAAPILARILEGLTARHGVYGVRGNHDINLFGYPLESSNTKLIDGCSATVHVGDAELELIGLPGLDRADITPELLADVPRRAPGKPRVVLSHYPDSIKRIGHWQADLFLSGHTHGGQICTPFGLAPLRHDSLPHKFGRGIYRLNRTWLTVNRGFGFSGWPIRMFCPAEVVEIRLVRNIMDEDRHRVDQATQPIPTAGIL